MAGEKIRAAQSALDRFLYDLLDRDDEMFLYRFSNDAAPASGVDDRPARSLSRALGRIVPNGGTAMYDAVAEAVPLAQAGQQPQEGARHHLRRQRHVEPRRRSRGEADWSAKAKCWCTRSASTARRGAGVPRGRRPSRADAHSHAAAVSAPGRGRRPAAADRQPPIERQAAAAGGASDDRVNVVALRDMTDDSGGRTEIVRDARDLESGNGEHRRRAEPAVLPGHTRRAERRTAAGTRSASKCARAPTACARGGDTWRASRMSACLYSRPPLG